MNKFLLDTDIYGYIMLNSSETLLHNLEIHKCDKLYISSVTYAELMYGAFRKSSKKIIEKILLILDKVNFINFDQNAAREYAKLRCELEKRGTPLGNMDMLIASCAISNNAILVTNNIKHFSKIDNLKIQNWTE